MKTASYPTVIALGLEPACVSVARVVKGEWLFRPASGLLSGPWIGDWPGRGSVKPGIHEGQYREHLAGLDAKRLWAVVHDAVAPHEPILVSPDAKLDGMVRRVCAAWFVNAGLADEIEELAPPNRRAVTLAMPPRKLMIDSDDDPRFGGV